MDTGSTSNGLSRGAVRDGVGLGSRRRELDACLVKFHALWHPQPFREARPAWCETWPALAAELLALPDEALEPLADRGDLALQFLERHLPEVALIAPLVQLPVCPASVLPDLGSHWAWEIPGRKRTQIEAFAAAAAPSGRAVFDWCGGKGHLGRFLARHWQVPTTSLDIDPTLCAAGAALSQRVGVAHDFVVDDALAAGDRVGSDHHLVALHACGELHRTAIRAGAQAGVAALEVAPCCYHRGVEKNYQPLASGTHLILTRDDLRLAVTETVTASPRQARRRDRDMAWKLGFDALLQAETGDGIYRSFKPLPPAWLADNFEVFIQHIAEREGLTLPPHFRAGEFEAKGWQRQKEVMRLSVVRYAFRRPLEIWLALDLVASLENRGYEVSLGTFCAREITPRNLLISARRPV